MHRRTFMAGAAGALAAFAATADAAPRKWRLNEPAVGPKANPNHGVALATLGKSDRTAGLFPGTPQISFKLEGVVDPGPPAPPPPDFYSLSANLKEAATLPGRYWINAFHLPALAKSYVFESEKHPPEERIGFTLAPGEVIYLGHVDFRPEGPILKLSVSDRFEEFRAKLPPELAGRIQKRLLVVPPTLQFNPPARR